MDRRVFVENFVHSLTPSIKIYWHRGEIEREIKSVTSDHQFGGPHWVGDDVQPRHRTQAYGELYINLICMANYGINNNSHSYLKMSFS